MSRIVMEDKVKEFMEMLEWVYGWTFTEEEKMETPKRVVNFFEEFYENGKYGKFTTFKPPFNFDNMIAVKRISFASICSHHLLPFFGTVDVVYIPTEEIFGLSKIPRIVTKFASMPQTQENMTENIAKFIEENIKPKGILVVSRATHTCMKIRGVKQEDAITEVAVAKGVIRTDARARQEAYNLTI